MKGWGQSPSPRTRIQSSGSTIQWGEIQGGREPAWAPAPTLLPPTGGAQAGDRSSVLGFFAVKWKETESPLLSGRAESQQGHCPGGENSAGCLWGQKWTTGLGRDAVGGGLPTSCPSCLLQALKAE